MKGNGDVAARWLKLAESDFAGAEVLVTNNTNLQGACFHCQQAAEKSLKAWLIAHDTPFPKEHDLERVIELCASLAPGFKELSTEAMALTPYAVKLRYDSTFWPSIDEARIALEQARRIYQFVKDHWN